MNGGLQREMQKNLLPVQVSPFPE